MANEKVLNYLVDTNRPYSCADITVNLRGAFSKSAVQKALDALSESGKIRCKLYGKQKVYVAIQTEVDDGKSDVEGKKVEDYDTTIKTLSEDIANKGNILKAAESTLKALTSAPTTDSAESRIDEIKLKIQTLEKKLDMLRNSTEIISEDERKKVLFEHDKYYREYRKRKRICSDMLEAVLEAYPKSKKDFLEELCIETDEMVDFKVNCN